MVYRITSLIHLWIFQLCAVFLLLGCSSTLKYTQQKLGEIVSGLPPVQLVDLSPLQNWTMAQSDGERVPISLLKALPAGNLLSVTKLGTVWFWSLTGESMLLYQNPLQAEQESQPAIFALSSKGRYMARSAGRYVEVIDLQMKELVLKRTLPVRTTALTFAEDLGSLYVGGTDGFIYRIFVAQSDRLEKYASHPTVVSKILTVPNTKLFVSGDWDGNFIAWLPYEENISQGQFSESVVTGEYFVDSANSVVGSRGKGVPVTHMATDKNGQFIILSYQNGLLEVWRRRGLSLLASTNTGGGAMVDMAVSSSGERIYTLSRDGVLRVWNLKEAFSQSKELREWTIELGGMLRSHSLKSISVSEEDELFASNGEGQMLIIDVEGLLDATE